MAFPFWRMRDWEIIIARLENFGAPAQAETLPVVALVPKNQLRKAVK